MVGTVQGHMAGEHTEAPRWVLLLLGQEQQTCEALAAWDSCKGVCWGGDGVGVRAGAGTVLQVQSLIKQVIGNQGLWGGRLRSQVFHL